MEEKISGRIVIAEDQLVNMLLIESIFKINTNCTIYKAKDGAEAIAAVKEHVPDLVLLDVQMPKYDGFEVAVEIKKIPQLQDIPIIFLTALDDEKFKLKGFESGGVDYVTKPIQRSELLARVNAHLNLKRLQDELKQKNALLTDKELHLTKLVDEKTKHIQDLTIAMVSALETANLENDEDTGNHIRRVSEFSAIFANLYGCEYDFIKRVKLYSPLHDVGKVGIPDAILKKPGKHTPEEWRIMQQHVVIGHRMLNSPIIDQMAKNIALYHHEKWSGEGYVNGLQKEQIPLEARIVMLADVYDALGQKRVYKEAFPEDKVDAIIKDAAGSHFEPKLVEIYFDCKKELFAVRKDFT